MTAPFLAAIFDMDGTLIASERIYRIAWQRTASELKLPLTAGDYGRLMGLNRPDTLRALATLFRSDQDAQAFLTRSEFHYDDIVESEGHEVRPSIQPLLDELARRGLPLAVATSTHRELAEVTLRAVGIRDYFSVVVTGDEVSRGKPDAEIYLRAATALRIPPARCLAFEDSTAGATAASAAGMTVVLIPELSEVEPTGIPRALMLAQHLDALSFFTDRPNQSFD